MEFTWKHYRDTGSEGLNYLKHVVSDPQAFPDIYRIRGLPDHWVTSYLHVR